MTVCSETFLAILNSQRKPKGVFTKNANETSVSANANKCHRHSVSITHNNRHTKDYVKLRRILAGVFNLTYHAHCSYEKCFATPKWGSVQRILSRNILIIFQFIRPSPSEPFSKSCGETHNISI